NFEAPVLCDIDTYIPKPDEEVLIAVMNLNFRKEMISALLNKKAKIGSFIHHSVIKPKNMSLGTSNIVFPFCILEKHVHIVNYNLLTSHNHISHYSGVGENHFFSTADITSTV